MPASPLLVADTPERSSAGSGPSTVRSIKVYNITSKHYRAALYEGLWNKCKRWAMHFFRVVAREGLTHCEDAIFLVLILRELRLLLRNKETKNYWIFFVPNCLCRALLCTLVCKFYANMVPSDKPKELKILVYQIYICWWDQSNPIFMHRKNRGPYGFRGWKQNEKQRQNEMVERKWDFFRFLDVVRIFINTRYNSALI